MQCTGEGVLNEKVEALPLRHDRFASKAFFETSVIDDFEGEPSQNCQFLHQKSTFFHQKSLF
jgi:hypothetical protein